MTEPLRWELPVPGGTIPILGDNDPSDITLILAHGAGSHMEQKTILWLAELVRSVGIRVVRFNFLYRVLGRGMPDRMPTLVSTYRSVIDSVRDRYAPKHLLIGGHSMGGRVASMLESEQSASDGLILFGYPLHPPDELAKLRDGHLTSIRKPTLQLNGTQDAFCEQETMERVMTGLERSLWTLHWIEGADHGYNVKRSSGRSKQEVEAEIRQTLIDWVANNL